MTSPEFSQTAIVIHFDKAEEFKSPTSNELPCGCGEGAMLVYNPDGLDYTTFSLTGEKVDVRDIPGYECSGCGLIALTSEVDDELTARIEQHSKRSAHE